MLIKGFGFENNATIRSALIYTIGLIMAWSCHISSPVFGILVASPLVMMHRFSLTVLLKRYFMQAVYMLIGILVAESFASSPSMIFVCSVLFFFVITYRIKTRQEVTLLPTLCFYYLFAVINSSYGTAVEDSVYSLAESLLLQLPVGWLLFKLFPTKIIPSISSPQDVAFGDKEKHFAFLVLVTTLLVFMLVDLTTSIFCSLVVAGCAFSSSKQALLNNVKNIVPIQVGGCLIGLATNGLFIFNEGNIVWASVVLLLLAGFFIHFANNKHLRLSDYNDANFENNILRAALVPLSLYVSPTDIDIEHYFHRSFDMLITALIMYGLYLLVKNKKGSNNRKLVI